MKDGLGIAPELGELNGPPLVRELLGRLAEVDVPNTVLRASELLTETVAVSSLFVLCV